jgi:hypothetical protein
MNPGDGLPIFQNPFPIAQAAKIMEEFQQFIML